MRLPTDRSLLPIRLREQLIVHDMKALREMSNPRLPFDILLKLAQVTFKLTVQLGDTEQTRAILSMTE